MKIIVFVIIVGQNWVKKIMVNKYQINVVGTQYIMTDTEEQAIELVEEKLKSISSSFNMQVFSIAQVNKGVLNDTK